MTRGAHRAGRGRQARRGRVRDPYAESPVDELSEPVLPRWFVLLAVVTVPAAIAVFALAFPVLGGDDAVPPAERRPPPADGELTHDVGQVRVGSGEPQPADVECDAARGLRVAGREPQRQRLHTALAALCELGAPGGVAPAIATLAEAEAVIRFAGFSRSGVPSTVDLGGQAPVVLINVGFTRAQRPRWITPLIVHDAVTVAGRAGTIDTELAARRAELAACEALFDPEGLSANCRTARQLLAGEDPKGALADAGYQ